MYEQVVGDGGEGSAIVSTSDPIPTWRLEQEEEEDEKGTPFNSRRMKLMLYIQKMYNLDRVIKCCTLLKQQRLVIYVFLKCTHIAITD